MHTRAPQRASEICRWWPAMAAVALMGCGGGGGSGSGGGAGLSYTVSPNPVSVQASTSDGASRQVTIDFTLINWQQRPPNLAVVSQVTWEGVAISSALSTLQQSSETSAAGSITVNLWQARLLGAGTYQGSVTLTLCFTADTSVCGEQAAGGPTKIPVTLTVTGDAQTSTSLAIHPLSLAVEAASNSATGPSIQPELIFSDNPAPVPYVSFTQPTGGVVKGSPSVRSTTTA